MSMPYFLINGYFSEKVGARNNFSSGAGSSFSGGIEGFALGFLAGMELVLQINLYVSRKDG